MRNYTVNWGKFLILRWFVASWLLHGVHVLDKTERMLYVCFEMLALLLFYAMMFLCGVKCWVWYVVAFAVLHTITWLVDSHWLVGYREVDTRFRGKGIAAVIGYLEKVKDELSNYPNIESIGVYGSMSRRMFHDRSDLDLRVIQNGFSLPLFFKIQQLRFVGIWKYKIPLDLKLVDSVEYVKNEMREDEKPIMIFKRHASFYNEGVSFEDLKKEPEKFTKAYTLSSQNL